MTGRIFAVGAAAIVALTAPFWRSPRSLAILKTSRLFLADRADGKVADDERRSPPGTVIAAISADYERRAER